MSFIDWRIPPRKKPLIALRLLYAGGYSILFERDLLRLFSLGYTLKEIHSACSDPVLWAWVCRIVRQTPSVLIADRAALANPST